MLGVGAYTLRIIGNLRLVWVNLKFSSQSYRHFIASYYLQVHCDVFATSIQACPRRENRAKSCYASCNSQYQMIHNFNDKFYFDLLLINIQSKHRTSHLKVVRKCFSIELVTSTQSFICYVTSFMIARPSATISCDWFKILKYFSERVTASLFIQKHRLPRYPFIQLAVLSQK